jgi:hypothetical protein
VHRDVWGGIKIENDYEGCFHAMVMIEGGGGVVRKTENIGTIRTRLDETRLTTYVSRIDIRYVVEKASG